MISTRSTQRTESECGYILITPMKNESASLLQLRTTILNQTHKPSIWVIVDSASIDDSFENARLIMADYNWIHVIRQERFPDQGYSHKNFAQAINEGYSRAKELSNEMGLKIEFIGKTDCTPVLSPDYFNRLSSELESDPNLAIVCGIQKLVIDSKEIIIGTKNPSALSGFNDIRLYRKEFFERMSGYPLTYSPDTVLLIKANIEGLKTKIIEDVYFIKTRLGGSRIGIWQGYELKGKALHYLGYSIGASVLNAIYHSIFFRPHYVGIPFFQGFIIAFINKEERINDKEVIEYLKNRSLLKEIFS